MLPLCAERDANGCVMHPSCQRTRDAYRRCVQDDTPLDAGFTPSCWRTRDTLSLCVGRDATECGAHA
eukprot:COSAG01_NODE_28107_length_669_cov_0.694737_1_plen_67_part_00